LVPRKYVCRELLGPLSLSNKGLGYIGAKKVRGLWKFAFRRKNGMCKTKGLDYFPALCPTQALYIRLLDARKSLYLLSIGGRHNSTEENMFAGALPRDLKLGKITTWPSEDQMIKSKEEKADLIPKRSLRGVGISMGGRRNP